jgi:FlaA1/EpsC-like NDP-sugar epimerase
MSLRWIERGASRIAQLPRELKVSIAVVADLAALPVTLLLALSLTTEASVLSVPDIPIWLFVVSSVVALATFAAFRLYQAVFRFVSRRGLIMASVAAVMATVCVGVIDFAYFSAVIPLKTLIVAGALMLLYMVGSRAFVRDALYFRRGERERVAIYGAGAAGAQLAKSLIESGQYLPVAFVDADPALWRKLVAGVRVYAPASLPALIRKKQITAVLLAVPTCSRRQRQAILKSLESLPVHVRTVPDISDIVGGNATVTDLREVEANDLLGRDPVIPNEQLLAGCIRGKSVMVTGAGGSIGSELCRQIVKLGPQRLVLVEISEAALYQIERELTLLASSQPESIEIVALLGNARHRQRMKEIMQTYAVQTVYHAAAYKHVPIVEQNVVEGIYNNVFSTWYAAEAALECRVETFVLISTDKAVNPTNVMGATKRLAELTLQALQERSTATRFCMVRFGNVLESSGSVVPLFREQIKMGGPVTVTHKDIIRYFMTIPEASQLVLQAGSMARGGEVFVLDMGEPVRIIDLARRMIHLMGLTVRDEDNPDGDIEIVITGLRPAEKLFEELLIGANVSGTGHPMIMRADEPHLSWQQLRPILDQLLVALESFDCAKARELLKVVAEYRPQSALQDIVWLRRRQLANDRANVRELSLQRARPAKSSISAP